MTTDEKISNDERLISAMRTTKENLDDAIEVFSDFGGAASEYIKLDEYQQGFVGALEGISELLYVLINAAKDGDIMQCQLAKARGVELLVALHKLHEGRMTRSPVREIPSEDKTASEEFVN